MRVAANAVILFEDRRLEMAVQEIGAAEAGDAGADDRKGSHGCRELRASGAAGFISARTAPHFSLPTPVFSVKRALGQAPVGSSCRLASIIFRDVTWHLSLLGPAQEFASL